MPASTLNDITVTILPDGTVRVETGSIDGPVHMAADKLLAWLADQLGGPTGEVRRLAGHVHTHGHGHGHGHEHH